jgi:hypothetical protein
LILGGIEQPKVLGERGDLVGAHQDPDLFAKHGGLDVGRRLLPHVPSDSGSSTTRTRHQDFPAIVVVASRAVHGEVRTE